MASTVALFRPDLVRGVALLSVPYLPRGRSDSLSALTELLGPTEQLPAWLSDEDVDYVSAEFKRTGYRGGLNWYRNSALNWELMAAWHDAPLLVPSLYVGGDRDLVLSWPGMRELVGSLREFSMPQLTKAVVLEGCGHWTQQERPGEVNDLLLEFLRRLEP